MKCPNGDNAAVCSPFVASAPVAFHRKPEEGSGEKPVHFRLIKTGDEQRLLDFFHSHTEATIHSRYGMMVREMSHQRALELVRLDGNRELAIVGLEKAPKGECIVAIGRYALEPATNLAEVAFVVHEQYRGLGIATYLLQHLVEIIRSKGFSGVTAQVLSGNTPMLKVLTGVLGRADQTTFGCGEMTLIYRFN